MTFNSLSYLHFLPLALLSFYLCPRSARWAVLLAASSIFYMAFVPKFILILALVIAIDYCAAIGIEGASGRRRKLLLVLSIAANCGILGLFKYLDYFNGEIARLASFIGWNYPISKLSLLLPLGLSFHTFQAMSYTCEVYRGRQKAERHLGIYALYVMFFPQLVAGPIERPERLIHQFHERRGFDPALFTQGLRLILWGFFKKLVVADRLALVVNPVYRDPGRYSGVPIWVATLFFAFQIYGDFSGYSDIAIGSAGLFGFRLSKNFDAPYLARSVPEFWRRWHISLSSWFRDYVYIPLGGNRVSRAKYIRNLFIVFILSGLWHGANNTFIAWGLCHFILVMVSVSGAPHFRRWIPSAGLRGKLGTLLTFGSVTGAWVFFRARSTGDALTLFKRSLDFSNGVLPWFHNLDVNCGFALIAVLVGADWLLTRERAAVSSPYLRWPVYYFLALAILALGEFHKSAFIYFQF